MSLPIQHVYRTLLTNNRCKTCPRQLILQLQQLAAVCNKVMMTKESPICQSLKNCFGRSFPLSAPKCVAAVTHQHGWACAYVRSGYSIQSNSTGGSRHVTTMFMSDATVVDLWINFAHLGVS